MLLESKVRGVYASWTVLQLCFWAGLLIYKVGVLARARPSRTGVRTVWIKPGTDSGTQQVLQKGHMQVMGVTKRCV